MGQHRLSPMMYAASFATFRAAASPETTAFLKSSRLFTKKNRFTRFVKVYPRPVLLGRTGPLIEVPVYPGPAKKFFYTFSFAVILKKLPYRHKFHPVGTGQLFVYFREKSVSTIRIIRPGILPIKYYRNKVFSLIVMQALLYSLEIRVHVMKSLFPRQIGIFKTYGIG